MTVAGGSGPEEAIVRILFDSDKNNQPNPDGTPTGLYGGFHGTMEIQKRRGVLPHIAYDSC